MPPNRSSKHRLCDEEGCKKQPSYGAPDKTGSTHCTTHKAPGMILKHKKATCKSEGCPKVPSYGLPCKPGRTHCFTHKLPGMVLKVKKPTCKVTGCQNRPKYGQPGPHGRSHCSDHRLEGMVIKQPECEEGDCNRRPCWGVAGGKAVCCSEHRRDGQFNWSSKCTLKGCNKLRRFGATNGMEPRVCVEHRSAKNPRDFKERDRSEQPEAPPEKNRKQEGAVAADGHEDREEPPLADEREQPASGDEGDETVTEPESEEEGVAGASAGSKNRTDMARVKVEDAVVMEQPKVEVKDADENSRARSWKKRRLDALAGSRVQCM